VSSYEILNNGEGQHVQGGEYEIFINYLNAAVEYNYELQAWNVCVTSSTHTGDFTTQNEDVYLSASNYYITGTVYDDNGTTPTVTMTVVATCLVNPEAWSAYGITNSKGQYSIYVWVNNHGSGPDWACGEYGNDGDGAGALLVTVENGFNNNNQWTNRWNQSIIIWAPQVVNFDLRTTFIGPYQTLIAEPSNAPSGYSTLSYESTSSYYNSFTMQSSFSGGVYVGLGGSVGYESSTTFSESESSTYSWVSSTGSLARIAKFWTSGTTEFDALNDQWFVPTISEYGNPIQPEQGSQYTQTWMYPGSSAPGLYTFAGYTALKLQPGNANSGNETFTSSTSTVSNLSVSFDINPGADLSAILGLPGILSTPLDLSWGFNFASVSTVSDSLHWEIDVPSGASAAECFDVYGQGGSASQLTATVVGIWAYAVPSDGDC
jgi:hypothetical protein